VNTLALLVGVWTATSVALVGAVAVMRLHAALRPARVELERRGRR
jgi:hypothetical protein